MKIIALDIGGTEVKGCLFDSGSSEVVGRPTQVDGGRITILETVCAVIGTLYTPDVQAIGLVTAGAVDPKNKRIVYNTGTLPGWIDFNLEEAIRQHFDVPVFVENDANGAMIAEMEPLQEEGIRDAVMLTLGTGVGTAVVVNGELLRGHRHQIEFGHMILYPGGKRCTCGKQGCLEQYVSGTALTKAAQAVFGKRMNHGSQLIEAYENGDKRAREVLMRYLNDLALALYNVQRFYDPECIILGGGVMRAKNTIIKALQPALEPYAPIAAIRSAVYGQQAGIEGAYRLARKGMSLDAS